MNRTSVFPGRVPDIGFNVSAIDQNINPSCMHANQQAVRFGSGAIVPVSRSISKHPSCFAKVNRT